MKLVHRRSPSHVHQHESRDREDGTGDERLPYRGRGAHRVLLEDGAAEERQAEGGDRQDRRREGGRHRLARLEPQVGVGRAEQRREQHAQHERLPRQLGEVLLGQDVRLRVVSHSRLQQLSGGRRDSSAFASEQALAQSG